MMGIKRTPPKAQKNNNNMSGNNDTPSQGPKSKRPFSEVSPVHQSTSGKTLQQHNSEVGNMQVVDLKSLIETSLAAILDVRLQNLQTKSDLSEITTKVQSLEQSNESLLTKMQQMEDKCFALERQVEFLERKSIERNLVLHIPSHDDDNRVIEKAKKVCLDLLRQDNPTRIKRTRLIRSRDNKVANIIVEMQESEDVPCILKNVIQLKNSGISIHRDYTKAARDKRRRLIQIKTDINEKNKNTKVLIRGQTLQINNKTFYLDKNNVIKCDEEDGMCIFRQLMDVCDSGTDSSNTHVRQNL